MTERSNDSAFIPDLPVPPVIDRRAAPGSPAGLRQLKGLLERPLQVGSHGGRLRVGLAERRRTPVGDLSYLVSPLRNELRERFHASPHGGAQVLRHLLLVHKVLGAKGWKGLETLPAALLEKALDQCEMLHGAQPSPLLETLAGQLRATHATVSERERRQAAAASSATAEVVVSELTAEEFEALQRASGGHPAA